ncbi:hypothetical protein PZ938_03565 [Luteipulveratus sp. YIM 133132]|uniref:Protoporphyrinogen oxidase n=1 Tax=Luteipulveratus flavus TaxID=3031728 RepID=A0ABT6C3F8_9MICO|nr:MULTISPECIES: hypothetical protein [unclassified Luteipulveratus]MDE9364672.1 hypothetical protein [Luteipulveratus sp. YIM 133132]MDF8262832.1 hypothetical protein [Luteipulveratus sp. YIM 133296]
MGKLSFLIGVGAGYVLGARAGKQRYEQIKTQANKVWENPSVQNKVGDVTDQVKSKAPAARSAAESAATKAATKVGLKDSSSDTGASDAPTAATDLSGRSRP